MKKAGMLLSGLLVLSNTVFASPALSGMPDVKVPITSPANRLVHKENGFGAQMYWSKEPHTRSLENVFISASVKKSAMHVSDSENLVYSLTELIDQGLSLIALQKTPYASLKEKSDSYQSLSAEIRKYDAGLLFYLDNQTNGEIGLHVILRDTVTGNVFGHYTANIDYDRTKGVEGKKEAFLRGVKSFVRELKLFRNGKRAVSETIYHIQ